MRQLRTNQRSRLSGFTATFPLPPLKPYTRCPCGVCPECLSNAKWDRIFAKFEVKDNADQRRISRSPLSDL